MLLQLLFLLGENRMMTFEFSGIILFCITLCSFLFFPGEKGLGRQTAVFGGLISAV